MMIAALCLCLGTAANAKELLIEPFEVIAPEPKPKVEPAPAKQHSKRRDAMNGADWRKDALFDIRETAKAAKEKAEHPTPPMTPEEKAGWDAWTRSAAANSAATPQPQTQSWSYSYSGSYYYYWWWWYEPPSYRRCNPLRSWCNW
jgi:hypothetical protein